MRPWTPEDSTRLKQLWGTNLTVEEISFEMSRNRQTIQRYITRLQLPKRGHRKATRSDAYQHIVRAMRQ